jgi:chromosome segregation ATPase
MVARLKLAEEPEPLSPERQKLASAISRRDEFQKRVVALEAAAATARDDERAALNDLERWREYLPTAVEAEVKIRVDAAIGKPTKKLEKSSAEARRQISELDETINTLKATREAMEKELEKTSRDFRIAEGDIDDCLRKIIDVAPEVERLLNDLATATKTYELLIEAVYSFPTPRHLQHLSNMANSDPWRRDKTLANRWRAAVEALKTDTGAPLPS